MANPYFGGSAPGDSASPDDNGAGTSPDPSPPPVSYHYAPSVGVNGVPIGSVRDFLTEGVNDSSPLGFALRPDHRELTSGETLSGLTIVSIKKGGAAAQAGLQSYHNHVKKAFEFASIAGSFFFPPAIVLMPLLDASRSGDHYDMIVGIDGYRVRDVLDFADCLRDVQPNQPIYLSVVRDGVRTQMQIKMPDIFSPE
ncbi:MAG TPA: PDZ domain-containing protein [Candidatus Binataceae bacterium]|nr:PDZ domain-containing protein [Candidatus Binataceae bacterium]